MMQPLNGVNDGAMPSALTSAGNPTHIEAAPFSTRAVDACPSRGHASAADQLIIYEQFNAEEKKTKIYISILIIIYKIIYVIYK